MNTLTIHQLNRLQVIYRAIRLALILLIFSVAKSAAQVPYQQIALNNYSLKEGLPSTNIFYIFQDSAGFIWIATDRGVSRFDGQQFRNFSSADGLESNEVFRIAEDRYHRVFFYCDNYRVCYYENGKIHRLTSPDKILWPPTASMFFNRYNELCVILGLRATIYRFPELKIKPHPIQSNDIVYGGDGEMIKLSAGDNRQIRQTLDADSFPLIANYIKPYRLEVKGKHLLLINKKWVQVYLSTPAGIKPLYRYHIEGDVNAVNLSGANTFCVSTFRKGLYIIDFVKNTRTNYLNGFITTHAWVDREQNLWFGTFDRGIFLGVNPDVRLLNSSSGLVNDHVLRLSVFNNQLFAGHILAGVSCIKPTGPQTFETDTLNLNQGRSDFNRITAFLPVPNRFMVIGTDNGIWKLSLGKGKPSQWPRLMYTLGPVKDIIEHNDTVSYLNHNAIRVIFDWKEMFGWYFVDSLRPTSFVHYHGFMMLGTMHGLYRLDYYKGNDNSKRTRLLENHGIKAVRSLALNGERYAIGTEDNGLFIADHTNVTRIAEPTLPSKDVRRVVWTDSRTLWACTSAGVVELRFEVDGQHYTSRLLNTSSGLPSDNIADVARLGDNYYIATDQGIAIVNDSMRNNNCRPLLLSEVNNPKNLSYTYGNIVSLKFYGLSYKSLGRIQYRFRLKGISKNWQTSTTGDIRFERLEPGNYTLEVFATDRFNRASEIISSNFIIIPLWYQQLWVQGVSLLLILITALLLARSYYLSLIRVQRHDFERKMALQNERQRISSEVHDDLGASIFGIKLRTELLSDKLEGDAAQKEINAIHQAISEVSVQVRLIIWSLENEQDDINSLISFIRKQAAAMLAHTGITLQEEVPKNEPELSVSADKRRQIYLIIKEAFNNIVKHAGAKTVLLRIETEKKLLRVTIADDGRGFSLKNISTDNRGIRNMNKRSESLHARLNIDTREGDGTTIILQVDL